MHTVQVRNVSFGQGRPKICVPIVAPTRQEILAGASRIKSLPADLAEWRADWFEGVRDMDQVSPVLAGLRKILGEMPLLFTFRTQAEGGAAALPVSCYEGLLRHVIGGGMADLVDIELFSGRELVRSLIQLAHENGVKVIVSSHDFEKTPSREELTGRLLEMQELGADLPKLAVMPRSPADVLTLLSVTQEFSMQAAQPIITMAMAGTGLISRISGEIFGSALTFGSAGQPSAPGQIGVTELRDALELLHRSL